MSKWLSLLTFISSLFIAALTPVSVYADASPEPSGPELIINEIRLGGSDIAIGKDIVAKQYITLFNKTDQVVDLKNWIIEYAKLPKANLASDFCDLAVWEGQQGITVAETHLDGSIEPHAISGPIEMQLTDNKLGAVRLKKVVSETHYLVHDLVGWGEGSPCSEGLAAEIPANSKSLFRYVDCEVGFPIDTNQNLDDFLITESSPGSSSGVFKHECLSDEDTDTNEEETSKLACAGVVISEILPNPSGRDDGKEFIELHNPTDKTINAQGCKLEIEGKSGTYEIGDIEIEPGGYLPLSDTDTGLILTNRSGGTVLYIAGESETVYEYPADMKDDYSYSLIGQDWQLTNRPTPGEPNLLMSETDDSGKGSGDAELAPCPDGKFRNPATNRCKNIESSNTLKPCGPGQQRNPQTNRCRSVVAASTALKPCKPGQERNPQTNRCRSIISTASSLKPCRPDQERNPETNRCRKINSASTELKPCKEGQERNPETNRCRNIQATLASADVNEAAPSDDSAVNYWLIGLVGMAAVGYGVYEYRNDISNKLLAVKEKLFSSGR